MGASHALNPSPLLKAVNRPRGVGRGNLERFGQVVYAQRPRGFAKAHHHKAIRKRRAACGSQSSFNLEAHELYGNERARRGVFFCELARKRWVDFGACGNRGLKDFAPCRIVGGKQFIKLLDHCGIHMRYVLLAFLGRVRLAKSLVAALAFAKREAFVDEGVHGLRHHIRLQVQKPPDFFLGKPFFAGGEKLHQDAVLRDVQIACLFQRRVERLVRQLEGYEKRRSEFWSMRHSFLPMRA